MNAFFDKLDDWVFTDPDRGLLVVSRMLVVLVAALVLVMLAYGALSLLLSFVLQTAAAGFGAAAGLLVGLWLIWTLKPRRTS